MSSANIQAQAEQNQAPNKGGRPQETIDCSISDFTIQIDSNHFEPRARAGDKLIMRRDAEAWEGAIVAVDAGMQEEVDGQWVNIDYAAALALKSYRAGMNYYAVAVAVMPKRPIQQAELQA